MKAILAISIFLYSIAAIGQPQFKGGSYGFADFLKKNTIYPSFSKDNCIQGTTEISFKLDAKGKVYFSKVTKRIGTDLDEEALRLVRMTNGKWQIPTDYDTNTFITVPVKFTLQGYNCEQKSKQEISQAINQYQVELSQINSIINFYKNYDQAKPGQEKQIIQLKKQLGIDDDYLKDKIETALKKIKQGDKQGACEDFSFVKNMGSTMADGYLKEYCN